MSLSDLASIGSFVSALAVLASLVYLSQQLRQNRRNQHALAQQNRASRNADTLLRAADPGLVGAFAKGVNGDPDMSLAEVLQFQFIARANFIGFEDAFFLHRQKLMDDASFDSSVANMKYVLSRVGARVVWKQSRARYDRGFAEFFDQLARNAPLAAGGDELARWNADLAAERALAG